MKIVLVGGGKVWFRPLSFTGCRKPMTFVLIEQDEAVLNHIVSRFDIIGLLGNGADFAILEQAGVQECDILSP